MNDPPNSAGHSSKEFLIDYASEETKAKDKYVQSATKDLYSGIDLESTDAIDSSLEAMKQGGKTDKSIRQSVMTHYGPIYKKAFLAEDDETMKRIESGMIYLNLGDYSFDWGDDIFEKWQNDAMKTKIE